MSIENNIEPTEIKNTDIENKPEQETAESVVTRIEGEVSDFKDSQGQVDKIEKSIGLDEDSIQAVEEELRVPEVLEAFDREAEILRKEAEQNIGWIKLDNHEFDKEGFYRIVDADGYQDYLDTNIIRSSPTGTKSNTTPGGINIGNRPTSFPSFAKGEPDMNYMPKDGDGYIFESDVPMYARGDINPVTGNKIVGRHWAYRSIDPETGKNVETVTPDMVKNIYKMGTDNSLHIQEKK